MTDTLKKRATGQLVRILVVISVLIGVWQAFEQHTLANCVADYDSKQSRAFDARNKVADQERRAQDALYDAWNNAKNLPPLEARKKATEAFEVYIDTRHKANAEREKHPLPDPPSEVCN